MKKLILFLLFSQSICAQEQKLKPHRYLGLGFNFGSLQSTEFVLNVDPSKYLRTEFRYGQRKSSEEVFYQNNNGQQLSANLLSTSRSMRLGLFGLLPIDDLLLFGGFRYSWGKSSNDYLGYDSFYMGYYVYESTSLINQIETVLGAEYRFANRLALGAETAYILGKTDNSSTALNAQHGTNKQNYFRTTAFIRFFPF
ncbi:MAG: hypothetical protein JNK73_05150 [Bacteroidia bacterium]|nr:hypothetical protein [Bacteroidia bacterium]